MCWLVLGKMRIALINCVVCADGRVGFFDISAVVRAYFIILHCIVLYCIIYILQYIYIIL